MEAWHEMEACVGKDERSVKANECMARKGIAEGNSTSSHARGGWLAPIPSNMRQGEGGKAMTDAHAIVAHSPRQAARGRPRRSG